MIKFMRNISFSTYLIGIMSAIGASFFFSLNDTVIKFLSPHYALYQVVLIRSCIAMIIIVCIIVPLEGGLRTLRTKRLAMHAMRGLCVVVANMTFFLALPVMPLADAVAIFFVSPLIITIFSVLFLGETVGPHRWFAVMVGLVGVVIMMRPGVGTFQIAALFPLIAAISYAGLHTFTRLLRTTEKAGVMTFYINVTFILVAIIMGIVAGGGQYASSAHPSLEFLLRAWTWPDPTDYWLFVTIGLAITFAGYLVSQAYRLCEAGLVAPFEYTALVLSIIWGYLVFGEWPDSQAWIGIILIVGGGLFMIWRENIHRTRALKAVP